jgi:iron complex transport system ATP-binding protein
MSGRRPYRSFQGYDASDERIALDAAKRLNVTEWLDRRGSDLSGGEYQRVLLARVLAQDTPLLLCDEPASSLDPKFVWSTFRLLKDLAHNEGVTVIVSIHDLALAATICDRLVLIKQGAICFDGLASSIDDNSLSLAYETSVSSIRTVSGTFFTYG